jgi:anthranilate phosphoribosyltransferase
VPQTAKGEGAITVTDIKIGAQRAAEMGMAALRGEKGATYDSLVYTGAIIMSQLGKADSLKAAADQLRGILDSGKAAERVR